MLRKYRRESGLTQRELAAEAGLSVAALRDFEQGRRHRPRRNSLTALADALGLDPDQAASLARAAVLPRLPPDQPLSPTRAKDGSGREPPADASRSGQGLWLSALGPLEAWYDGAPLPLGPPARRAVLGLLLLDPGALVRRDTIIDVLWGDTLPRTAVGLVQAHVSRIRRLMEPRSRSESGRGVIDSVGGAYRLSLSARELDLLAFRELAAQAASTRSAGDDVTAVELYRRAVSLWRGEPLADVDALSGHPGITALRQELLDVLLRYAEVACACGQHQSVLPRLQALADAEPLNEPAHARLIIALAGSGQQAAAIGVYEDMRLRLNRELGIYPGGELSEAYMRVLRQDIQQGSWEGAPPGSPVLPAIVHVVPRQLPAPPRGFTGRARELRVLSGLLERDARDPGDVVIAALTGMAGVGKTALAVHWAHAVAGQYPDGQLFVNLQGFSPSGAPITPAEALCGFLTALGVPSTRIPADTRGQAALYRSLLAGRRMLIVLDNARDAEQVRPLLPGSPGCFVLVTSRNWLAGLAAAEGAQPVPLEVLTESESQAVLVANLGMSRAMAEPTAVSELISLCGRLPLALCDVAARASARPGVPLAAFAASMRDMGMRLDALETREAATSVRMVFSWSRAKLGKAAARMFRLLAVHPGPDITVPAAASLAGIPDGQALLALAELCDEHLLTEHAPGRYACHDLVRAYAAEAAHTTDSAAERRAAVYRVLDYYLHTASLAADFLCPYHTEVTRSRPQLGVTLEKIGGPEQAAEWFDNERHVLLAMIATAAEQGYAPHAWQLPWVAGWYYQGEEYWLRLAAAQESALGVAAGLDDPTGQAMARQHLGWLRFLLGDIVSAARHLDAAAELARKLDDRRIGALTAICRAYLLQSQGRPLEAMIAATHALRLYQAAGDRRGEVRALYMIGWHLVQLGDHQRAADFSSTALRVYRESPWTLTADRGKCHSFLPNERWSDVIRHSISSNC
ncbi:MAG: BTAD domain-containing putative transcriptional regulator [Trebonia sp.]|jgi:DNA-binding SARP family transcriptional activator/DNA-binding XRE family transcriptional regulator